MVDPGWRAGDLALGFGISSRWDGGYLVRARVCALCLPQPQHLMQLQAEAPFGVGHAVVCGGLGVFGLLGAVHGLEEEVLEVQVLDVGGREVRLGVDEFEFVAPGGQEAGAGFGADAEPVDAGGGLSGAVGFDGDHEAAGMEGVDEGFV